MCVDNDSYPPIPPIAGGSAGGRDLRLTSKDGTKFMAYAARAANPTGAGMIVIPDVRGLHPYYKALADRFSEVGVDAIAFDFFARTAQTNLHIVLHEGQNLHHIVEISFKAFSRALRDAVELDPRAPGIPSTKGVLV